MSTPNPFSQGSPQQANADWMKQYSAGSAPAAPWGAGSNTPWISPMGRTAAGQQAAVSQQGQQLAGQIQQGMAGKGNGAAGGVSTPPTTLPGATPSPRPIAPAPAPAPAPIADPPTPFSGVNPFANMNPQQLAALQSAMGGMAGTTPAPAPAPAPAPIAAPATPFSGASPFADMNPQQLAALQSAMQGMNGMQGPALTSAPVPVAPQPMALPQGMPTANAFNNPYTGPIPALTSAPIAAPAIAPAGLAALRAGVMNRVGGKLA